MMRTPRLPRPLLALVFLFSISAQAATPGTPPTVAAPSATVMTARALFEQYWQDQLRDFPESATELGEARYSDRWHDVAPPAVAARRAARTAFLKKLDAIDPAKLSGEDRISWSVLHYNVKQQVALDALYGSLPFSADDSPFAVTQMNGIQLQLPALLRATPLKTAADYTTLIARLDALPAHLESVTALLKEGMRSGWMPAAVAIARVPSQFDPLLTRPIDANPIYAPFAKMPPEVAPADQTRLQALARASIETRVQPALAKLRAFLADVYLPAARSTIAATSLPGGAAFYQAMLTRNNTTAMSAEQIHKLGLQEVARLDKALVQVLQDAKFNGNLVQFNSFLNSDPQFFFASAEAMLASYRDIAKRIDARLPEQFVTLPRVPYGIRAMLPAEGDGPEHYSAGALDGSRAGYFEANVNNLKRRASWSMESLVIHEAMPGHHLQIARARELPDLPKFRRAYFNSGYGEGWALYAESLGTDLGMYTTPYTRYGYLTSEMFRACRLVVDTGMHAFGMSRADAIAYMVEHAAITPAFATAEIDRYIVWPGQATAYKLGQLKIGALREKTAAKLGSKFDVRRFNNEIVDHGALPLDVMDEVINAWIAGSN